MNSDNVILIGEVNKPGASAVLVEWLPLLLVACAGRLASLASVASFALLPHSHSAGSIFAIALSTWRKARTMFAYASAVASLSLGLFHFRRRSFNLAQGVHDVRVDKRSLNKIVTPANSRAVHLCRTLHAAESARYGVTKVE